MFCIVVNFFIWIVIKNYWYDIKSEKSYDVLMLIVFEKCENEVEDIYVACQTRPMPFVFWS
jgi:hypothetical protein